VRDMNKTLNERVDELEVAVKCILESMKMVTDSVAELKQPVIIEKVKYKNRVKPKPKPKKVMPSVEEILARHRG